MKVTKKMLFSLIGTITFLIGVVLVVCVLRTATVSGSSMESSFNDGDLLLVSIHSIDNISRGDVVVVWCKRLDEYLIKRVIGVEGDDIKLSKDGVFLNSNKLNETYIKEPDNTYYDSCSIKVPDNSYFILGDNRNNSTDSRSSLVGLVSEDDIYGKVVINISDITGLSATKLLHILSIICFILIVFIVKDSMVFKKSDTCGTDIEI